MDSMLVKHSLTLTMGRNARIRRLVNDVEDIVRTYTEGGYSLPQIVPVPDELDPEIPRMIFSARSGYTQILVSQLSINFNANYSPDWASNPNKCLEYLLSKIDMLFKIAEVGWEGVAPKFSGVTTGFQINAASASEATRIVAPSFADSERLRRDANEASYRWSLGIDEQYYNNISVATMVKLRNALSGSVDSIPRFNEKTVEGYGVEILGDYNDRMAYNMRENYESSEETLRLMTKAGFDTTSEVVASLLKRSQS